MTGRASTIIEIRRLAEASAQDSNEAAKTGSLSEEVGRFKA